MNVRENPYKAERLIDRIICDIEGIEYSSLERLEADLRAPRPAPAASPRGTTFAFGVVLGLASGIMVSVIIARVAG